MSNEFKIVFDEARFMADVAKVSEQVLGGVADKMINMMKSGIAGADTKQIWKDDLCQYLTKKMDESAKRKVSMLVGLVGVPEESWRLKRADVVEYGMGSERTGPRGEDVPIQHQYGVAGVNDYMTGMAPVSYRDSFMLPYSWNHPGSHWFENSKTLIDEMYDEACETIFRKVNPWNYFRQV